MERNRLIAVASAALLLYSAAGLPDTAEAAVGGMRAPRMTAPRMNAPRAPIPRANTPAPNARPNQQYHPSQRAGEIPSSPRAAAPSDRANMNSVPYRGTRWGNMMRNIGLLAGGMMLGGLLGNLFGFGAGSFMSDFFGLLINGLLIFAAFRFLSRLFGGARSGSTTRTNPYRQEPREENAAPFPIRDIRPPQRAHAAAANGTDYEPKRTADWYRSK